MSISDKIMKLRKMLVMPLLVAAAAVAAAAAVIAAGCDKGPGPVQVLPDETEKITDNAVEIETDRPDDSSPTDVPPEEDHSADYTIVRVGKGFDWNDIPELSVDHVLWTDDAGIRAQGRLCYDDENLYVLMRASERDIRAENTAPMSPVYEDSCLEFFFMLPDADNYFNFEINPNGRLCIQFGPDRNDRAYIVREDDKEYFDIRADRTPDGWEVRYRIPIAFLRLFYPDYRFEGVLKANMYKCGDKTAKKHYLSWNAVKSDKPDFHRPEDFGTMRFGE